MSAESHPDGITLVTHGSNQIEANVFMLELVRTLSPSANVNLGFLELSLPSLHQALEAHARKHARNIRIIPLFLAPGKHVLEDIPKEVEKMAQKYPQVNFCIETYLGGRKDFRDYLKSLLL